jgi:serine/threonine protein phosphatase 1
MSRTFVIGDIHGALKALKQVIAAIDPQRDDRLIFLGDYVDGWSESAQVIDQLIALDGMYSCIFIKGNHDAWCESWLNGDPAEDLWVAQGGKATIDSYRKVSRKQKLIHLEFLNRMRGYYIDDQNRLFIHAGYSSMHGPPKSGMKVTTSGTGRFGRWL